jgi:Flp pilus assembly pilin Flp
MRNLFSKLWNDDKGIVALEYLLVATIVGLGLVVGLAALEGALNVELSELANAILAINQSNSIEDQSNCKAFKNGWAVTDTPTEVNFTSNGPDQTSNIDESVCP